MPLGIRSLNWAGRRLRGWGAQVAHLDEAKMVQAAERKAGWTDWGDQRFRTPLRLLVQSYNEDPGLSVLGRFIARNTLIKRLVNRLRIRRDVVGRPAILEEALPRPLFIVGLPRTGTTLLLNLLAQDPAARPLLFWETMAPSPPHDPATWDQDPRIGEAERLIERLDRLLPELRTIHPLHARGPAECLGLLLNSFLTPFIGGRATRYREWLRGAPPGEIEAAYREYRQQLQVLHYRRRGGHLVLKCPSHLFGLDALLKVFPDACVVQTHRDVATAVASLCSMSAVMNRLSYEEIDLAEVGRHTVGIVELLLERCLEARRRAGDDRFLDLAYADLVRDPVAAVRRIYERFGYTYSDALEQRLRTYLSAQPEQGLHRYRPEDFALDPAELQRRLAPYCQRFAMQ
jgi:hypothetical protein